MKKIFLFLLSILFCTSLTFGQNTSQKTKNRIIPIKGTISGVIFDSDSIHTLPAVSIMLCNIQDSSMVQGTTTDNAGRFTINVSRAGVFFLKLKYMGYRDKIVTPILLAPQKLTVNFPKLILSKSSKKLKEVVVTSEPPEIEQTADKTTLNVSQSLVAAGGSALDLLQLIPSVTVNSDGSVQLRGSDKVKILMDGRPSMFSSLEQVPVQMLDKVEVMNNPSARYESEGQAGIINLITNKNKIKGYMVNVNTNTNTRGASGGGVNVGYRKGHWNLMAFYNYRTSNVNSNTKDSLSYFKRDTITTIESLDRKINQQSISNRKTYNHNFRFNTDYFFNENTTLTFQMGFNIGNAVNKDSIGYNYQYYLTQQALKSRMRRTHTDSDNNGTNFLVAFDKKFSSTQELTTEFSINTGRNDADQNIYETDNSSILDQFLVNDSRNHSSNLKIDYEQTIWNNVKLEVGERSNWSNNKLLYIPYNIDPATNATTVGLSTINDFDFDRTINSLYMILTFPITQKLSVKAGARYEQTKDSGTQIYDATTVENKYKNIYPSVFITQKFNEFSQLNLIYSRRMDRPDPNLLNPLINKSNPLAISVGNSDLKPEDSHSFELKYIYDKKVINISSSIFSRISKDMISRSITMKGDTTYTTYSNQDNGFSYGGEFNATARFNQIVRLGFSANWNHTHMNLSTTDLNTDTKLTMWNMRLNANFNIPDIISFQMFSNYFGPTHRTTGSTDGFFTTDLGIRKQFFNRKISAFVRINDVFDSRKTNTIQKGYISNAETYYRAVYGRQSSRFVTFGLNFNFSNFIRRHDDRDRRDMPPRDGGGRYGGGFGGPGGGGPGGFSE